MTKFTDIFIRRPVFASVLSFLLFFIGLRAFTSLELRQFPKVEDTTIEVSTFYPGADADLVQGFVTSPLEKAMAGAEGISYLTAQSTQGMSTITANIELNYDPEKAFTEIMSKVAEVRGQLPAAAQQPVIQKKTGAQVHLMYISFSSSTLNSEQITDYLTRVVQPHLQTVPGVAQAEILGGSTFAMRIWLNPQKMTALGISGQDVELALQKNNFQSTAGSISGPYVSIDVNAKTDLNTVDEFKAITLKSANGHLVRLGEVASVELGAESYDSSVIFDGKKAVFIGVSASPSANPLTVIDGVRAIMPHIAEAFPAGLKSDIVYDATSYIKASIHEVIRTLLEASAIVILVILLFLGSVRTVTIPMVTIPLSLIGVGIFMLALGYSINLLTLLALVLAIGMVVDDAIVVVENIYRHIEAGMTPFDAALRGAREIAAPVITMSITLAAVYAPIAFMSGITGALFKEFALTLAGAVLVSGFIALTLSPMMCSKLLSKNLSQSPFVKRVDALFERLHHFYQRRLHGVLNFLPVTVTLAVVVLFSCYPLYVNTQKEMAPAEDQGVLFMSASAPQYANINYLEKFTQQFDTIFQAVPEMQHYLIINGAGGPSTAIAGVILKPWQQRTRSQNQVQADVQPKLGSVAGLQSVIFPLPSLPMGHDMLPVSFVLTSTGDYQTLFKTAETLKQAAQKSGLFMFVDSSLKFDRPQFTFEVNRAKAAQLGMSMQDIASALGAALSGNFINYFSLQGRSYKVIPQVTSSFRLNPGSLDVIRIRAADGHLVPLSTVVTLHESVKPNSLTQFQQLNSATLQGIMMPGRTLGDGLQFLSQEAKKTMPHEMNYDFSGQSRQYMQEGNALMFTFFFSLLIIFLVLAAQFESYIDPLIILISVPMSICGALIPLNLGLATINIYTQIGLITLIGLISKHGILMVEFANQLQEKEGLSPREAIEKAAGVRLRPILMTTAAMVLGALPLVFASGAGARSRFDIGLVISSGMLIGTLFTLFVVPSMYLLLSRARKPQHPPIHPID